MRYRKGDVITVSLVVTGDQIREDSDVEVALHQASEDFESETVTVPVGAIVGLRERPIRSGDSVELYDGTVHVVIHAHGDSLWVEDRGIVTRDRCTYHHPPADLSDPPARRRARSGRGRTA